MIDSFILLTGANSRRFRRHRKLLLENASLREQLAVLKRRRPRLRLSAFDKFFRVLAQGFWFRWKQTLILVGPKNVLRSHRSGFALHWRVIFKASRRAGKKSISTEISDLNFRIVSWNLSAHKRTDSEDGACVHLPAAEVISPKRCGVWDFAADSRIHPASF